MRRYFLRSRRGSAAVEFALILPLLTTIVLGLYDLASVVQLRLRLADAVRAGGQYAAGFPTDSTGIMAAVQAALPSGWTNSAGTPTTRCTCWNGGTETDADCTAATICATGQTAARYVTVTASRSRTSLLLTGLGSASATYVARVQ